MTKLRLAAAVLVAGVLGAFAATAGAADPDDPRAARDEARRERAALAADLDVLEASEAELDAAAAALAADVRAQAAKVESSRQAVGAAAAEVERAEQALAAAETRIDGLTNQLVDRAVDNFIAPQRTSLYDVAVSADFSEAARKQAFIHQVVADEAALVDQLRAAHEDLDLERQAATSAKVQAAQRRAETEDHLVELEAAAVEQERLQTAVEERQANVVAEIEALEEHEAELNALIEQRAKEERERVARERAEAEAQRARAAERQRAVDRASAEQRTRDHADRARNAPPPRPPAGDRREPPSSATTEGRSGEGGCIWPTRGTVTSEYGSRWGRLHAGIDISAPIGTPIYAAKAGTVLVAGTQSGYGTTIVLDHGAMTTLYAHQSRLVAGRGDSVTQGQLIGYVGNTGQSTGPHLHFETRYDGSPRNPRSCLP